MESRSGDPQPQVSEGISECRWISADEAEKLIIYENARAVLRRAREMVAAREAESATRSG
jgi:hypothetical protein